MTSRKYTIKVASFYIPWESSGISEINIGLACQRIDAFELWCWRRLLRAPWTCKEIKPVNTKGNKPWIFIGRTDAETEVPISKSQLIWKVPDAGKDWRQKEKGTTENEMVGWHHRLNGHEFEQALGDGDGQEGQYAKVHGFAKSWTWPSNWTTTKGSFRFFMSKNFWLTQLIHHLSPEGSPWPQATLNFGTGGLNAALPWYPGQGQKILS